MLGNRCPQCGEFCYRDNEVRFHSCPRCGRVWTMPTKAIVGTMPSLARLQAGGGERRLVEAVGQ